MQVSFNNTSQPCQCRDIKLHESQFKWIINNYETTKINKVNKVSQIKLTVSANI